jgi:hypothetical protein
MRPNRDRRNRRRRGESWQFRRSAASTIVTNAGPHEDESRGCSHFAGRSVSRESLPDGQHREDGLRTADHCPPCARYQHLPGHSIGNGRSHVAADGIRDRDRSSRRVEQLDSARALKPRLEATTRRGLRRSGHRPPTWRVRATTPGVAPLATDRTARSRS